MKKNMKKKVVAVIIAVGLLITILSVRGGDVEDVSGTYKNVSVLPSNQIILSSDKSWDADIQVLFGYDTFRIQGLYENRGNYISLDSKFSDTGNLDGNEKFDLCEEGGYYYRNTVYFEEDDYGRVAHFDENGRSNQMFSSYYSPSHASNDGLVFEEESHEISLKFNEDGTFSWINGMLKNGMPEVNSSRYVRYEGTYSVNEDIITLHYNNTDHFMILDDGVIYYDVYQKQN